MITEDQVVTALSPIIENVGGMTPEGNFDFIPSIVLERSEDGSLQSVTVDTFVNLFGASVDMKASSLLAVDGGTMGYAGFINGWQTAGYIV